jgi:glycosyltransferase involved in cell wall biosynthesis
MRIGINALFMIPGGVGGSETYLRNLIQHLEQVDRANEYIIFVNRESSNTFALVSPNFRELPCPVPATFRTARILYEQLILPFQAKGHRIEILHSPGYTAPAVAPCPSVVTIYDVNFVRHPEAFSRLAAWTLRALVPMAAHRCDLIITLSENSRRDIVAELGVSADKVRTIYPAANVLLTKNRVKTAAEVEARYNLRGRVILSVAASHPHKNLRRLVEAYEILRRKYSVDHQLMLVGLKGRDHPVLLELIGKLSFQEEVILTGWVPAEHLSALYAKADVLVFPSLYEGFGLPVLEAMEHGVPVVTANVPSLSEAAGDATMAVDPHDAKAIAAAIHRVLVDPAFRERLVAKGYEHARMFSWEQAARQTLAVYEQAVSRSNSGDSS